MVGFAEDAGGGLLWHSSILNGARLPAGFLWGLWADEIPCSEDGSPLDGEDLVAVLEAAVEHGDGHASSTHADIVQSMALEHFNLIAAVAVVLATDAVPGIPFVMHLHLRRSSLDGVGRLPHLPCLPNECELCQSTQYCRVVRPYEHRVLPAARADKVGQGLGPMSHETLHLAEISLAHRQVGRVEWQILAAAALDRLVREPAARVLQRVGRTLLVGEGISPDVEFPSWILHLACRRCRRAAQDRHRECEHQSYDGLLLHSACKVTSLPLPVSVPLFFGLFQMVFNPSNSVGDADYLQEHRPAYD